MERLLVPLVALCATASAAPFSPPPSYGSLWPAPLSLSFNGDAGATPLAEPTAFGWNFNASSSSCQPASVLPTVQAAFLRLPGVVFPFFNPAAAARRAPPAAASSVTGVVVCVAEAEASTPLALGVDESYTLAVPASGVAEITAPTVYGALHALTTFSQLVQYNSTSQSYAVDGLPLSVRDAPRYSWRGLLIDTARHFLPVTAIKRQLDAMSASKLNVLHWHVVDAQSFPFQSVSYPLLSERGAYHPSAVYTPDDVREVVSYAAGLGVRVVPEFDVPGHAASWQDAYPEVITQCPSYAHNINNLNLSPASNMTVPLLQGIIRDAVGLWPDEFVHLGGDEVVQGCWAEDKAVQRWMAEHHTNTTGVYKYFSDQATAAVTHWNRRAVQWQEVVDYNLGVSRDTIVEVWDGNDMKRVTGQGYTTIFASAYYLDRQLPDGDYSFYEFEDTWKSMYVADPADGLTAAEAKLVVGGEACMWGEQVSDASVDTRVWPRAAAVAETLWSPAGTLAPAPANITLGTTERLNAHSCRLQRLGIGSSPVLPAFCLMPQQS